MILQSRKIWSIFSGLLPQKIHELLDDYWVQCKISVVGILPQASFHMKSLILRGIFLFHTVLNLTFPSTDQSNWGAELMENRPPCFHLYIFLSSVSEFTFKWCKIPVSSMNSSISSDVRFLTNLIFHPRWIPICDHKWLAVMKAEAATSYNLGNKSFRALLSIHLPQI